MDQNTVFRISASVTGTQAVKQLSDEIKKVSTNGEGMKRAFANGAVAVGSFIAVAATATGAVTALAIKQIDLADNMNDISQRTGVAVSELAKYAVAAGNSGTSLESLAKGFNKLNKNLVEAKDGTGATASALRAMGISIRDSNGHLKNADQITGEVADRFKDFEDGSQKSALAAALFGKGAADLIPMLNMGSEAIKEFGLDIDQDFASASDNFNDKLGVMRAEVTNMGVAIAKEMLPALSDGVDAIEKMFDTGDSAKLFGQLMSDAFRLIIIGATAVVAMVKNVIDSIKGMGQAAAGVVEMAKGNFGAGWSQMKDAVSGTGEAYANNFRTITDQFKSFAQDSYLTGDWSAAGQAARAQRQGTGSAPSSSNTPQNIINSMSNFSGAAAADKAAAAADRAAKAAAEWIAKQRESIETLKMESEYIGRTTNEIDQMKDSREIMTQAAEKAATMVGKAKEEFLKEAKAIADTRREIMQFNYEQSRTFGAGARSFLAKYAEDATNTAEQVKTALSSAFKGAEDALVNFVTTGKFSFKGFAQSIISDLARIAVQRSIMGPLSSALGSMFGGMFSSGTMAYSSPIGPTMSGAPMGFANGGIMTSGGPLPLKAYSNGGIANSPQLALFGEGRMNEAYVPLPDGRSIPVTLKGGGGQVNNISVTVNAQSGDTTTSSSGSGQNIAQFGKLIADKIRSTLIEEKRPGGLLWEA